MPGEWNWDEVFVPDVEHSRPDLDISRGSVLINKQVMRERMAGWDGVCCQSGCKDWGLVITMFSDENEWFGLCFAHSLGYLRTDARSGGVVRIEED